MYASNPSLSLLPFSLLLLQRNTPQRTPPPQHTQTLITYYTMPRRNQQQDFPPFFFNMPGQGVDNHDPWGFTTIFGADPRGPAPPPPPPPPPRGSWGHWAGGPGAAWAYSPWGEDHDHHARRRSRHGRRGGHGRPPGRYASDNDDDNTEAQENRDASNTNNNENETSNEKHNSPDTMNVDDAPDPEEVVIQDEDGEQPHGRHSHGRRGGPFCRRMRGGPRGGGGHRGRGGVHNNFFAFGPGAHHHHHHPHPHPPPPYDRDGSGPNFNFGDMMRGLTGNPLFQNFREQFINSTRPPNHHHHQRDTNNDPRDGTEQDDDNESSSSSSFTPPVDVFNIPSSYILHIALPGAKKEDIAVNWDPESHLLSITGVVHRPGDEEFLNTLVSGERKIGMFEREITLPPQGSDRGDEVDGEGIGAKMENGILVITVPKVEKEWTEVRKVDIE